MCYFVLNSGGICFARATILFARLEMFFLRKKKEKLAERKGSDFNRCCQRAQRGCSDKAYACMYLRNIFCIE